MKTFFGLHLFSVEKIVSLQKYQLACQKKSVACHKFATPDLSYQIFFFFFFLIFDLELLEDEKIGSTYKGVKLRKKNRLGG